MVMCRERTPESRGHVQEELFVVDTAYIFNNAERDYLNFFLDSLNKKKQIRLAFCSVSNHQQIHNTDSLAALAFGQFGLEDNGGLIFVSMGTRSCKILVGEKLHHFLSNEKLDTITTNMFGFFREKQFLAGVKHGFLEMSEPVIP
jgi:uncharacterized membrane protein YgcG